MELMILTRKKKRKNKESYKKIKILSKMLWKNMQPEN